MAVYKLCSNHGSNKTKTKQRKNPMIQKLQSKRGGFTLVEIMIVVAIIALLAAIAVPNFLRARKRSQATRVLEDLRDLDHALDQYAIDNSKTGGTVASFADVQAYIKAGTVLAITGADVFGDSYGPNFTVDSVLVVPSGAWTALSDVAPATFWSPYITGT